MVSYRRVSWRGSPYTLPAPSPVLSAPAPTIIPDDSCIGNTAFEPPSCGTLWCVDFDVRPELGVLEPSPDIQGQHRATSCCSSPAKAWACDSRSSCIMKVLTDGAGSKCCCWFLESMVNSRSLCRVNYVKFQWRDWCWCLCFLFDSSVLNLLTIHFAGRWLHFHRDLMNNDSRLRLDCHALLGRMWHAPAWLGYLWRTMNALDNFGRYMFYDGWTLQKRVCESAGNIL